MKALDIACTWSRSLWCQAHPGPPLKPTDPSPLNGATGISVDSAISWSNGGGATSYNVYFGTNSSPGSGEFKGNQTSLAFDPGVLNYSATYYWRIDAINPEGTTTGDIWHFTTRSGEDLIVSNLTVDSGEDYEVVNNGLVDGALAYIDRSYKFTDIPVYLEGATYIKTANDDKGSVGDDFLSFDVTQDVTVYVAHDDSITDKPSWLLDFTDTGDQLVTTDKSLSIYARDFSAGTITLGGNEGPGHSMYVVALVVVSGSPGPPLKPTDPSPLNGATGILSIPP